MGKKDKAKTKNKAAFGPGDIHKQADPQDFDDSGHGVAAGGDWGAIPEERIDEFGPGGWGESPIEENGHTPWRPEPNGDHWEETQAHNIHAWMADRGDEIPSVIGTGPKRHPSAAVRMSLANQYIPPDVATLLQNMQMDPHLLPSPKRAPTEISVHRSSAAFSGNPLRSAVPTRANSFNGGHSAPIFPSAGAHLQQTRFFPSRPAQPLSTIHSDRSLNTIGDLANAPPGSRQTWLPANNAMPGLGSVPGGFVMDDAISTQMLGMQDQEEIVSFQESGGEALVPADRALFGDHRPAKLRFRWDLSPDRDESVRGLLNWVDIMAHGLASLAIHKFIDTKSRGALISNAAYRPTQTPDEPAFDWITFEQSRGTLDATFQEGIAKYDPMNTFIVYVFLLSSSGNSVGIWRRKLAVPEEVQANYGEDLRQVISYVKRQRHIVAVEELPPGAKTPGPPTVRNSTRPLGATAKQSFTSAGQDFRSSRHASAPVPAKTQLAKAAPAKNRESSVLKKDPPEKEKKRSTWSKIFGGKK